MKEGRKISGVEIHIFLVKVILELSGAVAAAPKRQIPLNLTIKIWLHGPKVKMLHRQL